MQKTSGGFAPADRDHAGRTRSIRGHVVEPCPRVVPQSPGIRRVLRVLPMEEFVSVDEIIHTCSNENVARAAVASIGSAFAQRVRTAADLHGLSVGAFTARAVHDFAKASDEHSRSTVRGVMEGSQQPILSGLKSILERRLDLASSVRSKDQPTSVWTAPAADRPVRKARYCFS